MRIRILSDYSAMGIWVDTDTKQVVVDWYGTTVCVGDAKFSEESDCWLLEMLDGDLRHVMAPEGRYSLQDELDEGLFERIDDEVNENQGEWFKDRGVSPTELLFGAESAQDGVNE